MSWHMDQQASALRLWSEAAQTAGLHPPLYAAGVVCITEYPVGFKGPVSPEGWFSFDSPRVRYC